MSELPVLPLWVTKYEGNTAHLSMEEDGAYMRLLRLCWRTPGCTIPSDPSWIMRHMRADEAGYQRAIKPILDEFFVLSQGRWQNQKLLEVYHETDAKTKRRQVAGQKGGKAKALKTANKQPSNATVLLDQCSGKPKPKPQGEPIGSFSEAKASEPSARDIIFNVGKSLLAKQGVGAKAAGAVLGALQKAKGATEAQRIVVALQANPPLDAESYLWGIIKGRPEREEDAGAAPQLELVMVDGKPVMLPVGRRAA